jgi:adenosyl cobinamide kinase/adenosyl cobinamide phosphate guanylyltransferase
MTLTVLLGGAGSGKSRLAVRTAQGWDGPVAVVVTAEARDDEMAEKIRRHRANRPKDWVVVEEPLELEAALISLPDDTHVIVDCLTLWVSNLVEKGATDHQIEEHARSAAKAAGARTAEVLVVSNEVGSGIVPSNALARRYRDVLGRVNAVWAEAAERTFLVVAGRVVPLAAPDHLFGTSDGG